MNLMPSPGGSGRRIAVVAAGEALVAVVALTVYVVARPDTYTVTHTGESSATTVTVPREAGRPVIDVLPPASPETLPVGMKALSHPVRISAGKFSGAARITMTYDPAALPPAAEPLEDLAVLVFSPDLHLWLPAGDQVDTTARTVIATTEHPSEWMLAVTDPARLRYDQDLAARLRNSASGWVVETMYGSRDALRCAGTGDRLRRARVKSDLIATAKLCQQVRDDGTHLLQWVNTTELPIVFDLPAGFTQKAIDYYANALIQGVLQQHRHPHGAVIAPGRSLAVTFRPEAVTPDTQIVGELDWSLYLIALVRQLVGVALLDPDTDNPTARAAIDTAFNAPNLVDCVADGTSILHESSNVALALTKAVSTCTSTIAKLIVDVADRTGKKGRSVVDTFGRFFSQRVNMVLAIPNLMAFARAQIAGLLALPGTVTGELDTTVTIVPDRDMTYEEAMRLPVTPPDPTARRCRRLPSRMPLPQGMPSESLCIQVVDLDLDGNTTTDRLLVWRPKPGDVTRRDPIDPTEIDAIAFLDRGASYPLKNPPATWGTSSPRRFDDITAFELHDIVHLGDDVRAQAVFMHAVGANTDHFSMLTFGNAPGQGIGLYAVTGADGDVFTVTAGGGAAGGSAFGCVVHRVDGQIVPLFMTTTRSTDLTTVGERSEWQRTFYQLTGTRMVKIGSDKGTTTSRADIPTAGSDCTQAAPSKRGPTVTLPN